MIKNALKAWNNFGVYGHSRVISFVVHTCLHLVLVLLKLFHKTLDSLPCILNNPKKLSPELRSIDSILSIIKLIIPISTTWPMLNVSVFRLDCIYLKVFNRITNYGLGSLSTIPITTNILTQKLFKTHFIISCSDKLKKEYDIDFDIKENVDGVSVDASKPTKRKSPQSDGTKFRPRNVEYIWISGNDEIEKNSNNNDNNKIIMYIHGGGFSLGGPSHIGYVSRLSSCTNMKILFVHYAKPPIADIPYQVDQMLTIYFYLLLHNKMNPKRIILCGDSAGGGLCTLFIQKLSLLNLSKIHPLGVILYSPWVDLSMSADSWLDAQYHDLIVDKTYVSRSGLLAVGNDPNNLKSPYFSAVYVKKYEVECHVMIFVSKHECLYDDSQKLVETLRENNTFNEYSYDNDKDDVNDNPVSKQGMGEKELIYIIRKFLPHVYPIFYSVFPEADSSMNKVCQTIKRWSKDSQNSSFVLK